MVVPYKIKSNFTKFYTYNKLNQWFKSNICSKNMQFFQFYPEVPTFYYYQRKSVSS